MRPCKRGHQWYRRTTDACTAISTTTYTNKTDMKSFTHRDAPSAFSLQDLRLNILQAQPFGFWNVEDDKHEGEHRYGCEQKEDVGWAKVPL
jgi:hypothetical protein